VLQSVLSLVHLTLILFSCPHLSLSSTLALTWNLTVFQRYITLQPFLAVNIWAPHPSHTNTYLPPLTYSDGSKAVIFPIIASNLSFSLAFSKLQMQLFPYKSYGAFSLIDDSAFGLLSFLVLRENPSACYS
jgi:hypothetical protein